MRFYQLCSPHALQHPQLSSSNAPSSLHVCYTLMVFVVVTMCPVLFHLLCGSAVLAVLQIAQPREPCILTEHLEVCRLRAVWLRSGTSWTFYFSVVISSFFHCIALDTFCRTSLLNEESSTLTASFFLPSLQLLLFALRGLLGVDAKLKQKAVTCGTSS